MTEQVLARIDALAAKLGVATAQLWDAVLWQVRLDAVSYGVWAILFGLVAYALLRWKPEIKEDCYNELTIDSVFKGAIKWSGSAVCAYVAVGAVGDCLYRILNPEFYVVKTIASLVAN